MAFPTFNCASCAHPAGTEQDPVHAQAGPHPCTSLDCFCLAFNYGTEHEASEFEGGGGSGGGGGASGSW